MAKSVRLLLFIVFALPTWGLYEDFLPECDSCIPTDVFEAPGVGIDLSLSSAASAVRFLNWSSIDVAHVSADDEYRTTMQRLSKASSPDRRWFRKYLRRINKALGRPATPDVGVISTLLSKIKNETEKVLSIKLDKVAVAVPRLDGLTLEDINDALEYAGLQSWIGEGIANRWWASEATAAFGAYGNGLCENYRHVYDCKDEELPWHRVYAVSFSRSELYTTIVSPKLAFSNVEHLHFFDFEAGLDAIESYNSTSNYWTHVQEQLAALLIWANQPRNADRRFKGKITKFMLLGDSAGDKRFHTALQNALGGLEIARSALEDAIGTGGTIVQNVPDPKFVAARGAAIYARWRLESTWYCAEEPECFENRKREHDGNFSRSSAHVEL